jgi:hypothetical protein
MKIFRGFTSYNEFIGLAAPLNDDVDVGYYDPPRIISAPDPETFYQRQFSTDPKQYNRIVTDFQQCLGDHYNQPVKQLPNVQYFADQLGI